MSSSSQPHPRLGDPTHPAHPEPARPSRRHTLHLLSLPLLFLRLLAFPAFILAHFKLERAQPEPAHHERALPECVQPEHIEPESAEPECVQSTQPDHFASAHNLSSMSIDIPGVPLSNTCMTPTAGISDAQLIRRTITSPHGSLGQSIRDSTRRTMIEMLPENILLDIFDFYRLHAMELSGGRPWKWHHLAHVCRKWRYIVSISQRRLDLRILCGYGAPIESILGSWPTLPLVIRFNTTRKSKPMPKNILVALRCPDRICEINLTLTSSMTGPIVELIQKPCPALEKVRITVKDAMGLSSMPAHDAFLGGCAPHLREIELHGIALPFPAIRQVLSSANDLVELHLSNIPNAVYFSPIDLVTALSTLGQLKRLTIGFHSPTSHPAPSTTRRSRPQPTALSLEFLDFHGAKEYLEEFVARIDLPALRKITVKLFNCFSFEIPQFSQFISHQKLNVLWSPTLVLVTHTAESVSVFLIQEENPSPDEHCCLGTSCRRLDQQLSFVTQILSQLSPLLSSVAKLTFVTHSEMLNGKEDVEPTQWLELFQLFTHVREIHVFDQLVPDVVQALVTEDMDMGVLPELTSVILNGYRKYPSVAKAAEEFVVTRRLSGRTIFLLG